MAYTLYLSEVHVLFDCVHLVSDFSLALVHVGYHRTLETQSAVYYSIIFIKIFPVIVFIVEIASFKYYRCMKEDDFCLRKVFTY